MRPRPRSSVLRPPVARRGKFNAVRTTVDGITFASKKEARRYQELRLLEKAGEISDLRCQVPYVLTARINPVKVLEHRMFSSEDERRAFVGRYVVDFEYIDKKNGWTVEDVKGFRTPLYRWKAKHFEAQYGRKILET